MNCSCHVVADIGCQLSADPTDSEYYFVQNTTDINGNPIRMRCGPETIFNELNCTCVHGGKYASYNYPITFVKLQRMAM